MEVKIRYHRNSGLYGIKETYKVLRDGNNYSVDLLFGLDGNKELTKPAVYSSEGYCSLSKLYGGETQEEMERVLLKDMSSRLGVYSVGKVTLFLVQIRGKFTPEGDWVTEPTCRLFFQAKVSEDFETLTCLECTDKPKQVNALYLQVVSEIKERLLKEIPLIATSRSKFLSSRFFKS